VAPRTLIWSPDAIRDLHEIAGRRVPEFDRENMREMIKRGYRVMYRVSDELVEIVAVIEGHRRVPADILDR
jgi:toxin ParE1/3/4